MASTEPASMDNNKNIDPQILNIVGNLSRPSGNPPLCTDLHHLPGQGGIIRGMQLFMGVRNNGSHYTLKLRDRYGPVFRCQYGPIPGIMVCDPELISTIFRNHDGAWSAALGWAPLMSGVDQSSHDMMVGAAGGDFEEHRELRKLMVPAFSSSAIDSYINIVQPMMAKAVDNWCRAREVHFKADVRALLANMAVQIFMGIDDPVQSAKMDSALTAFWKAPTAIIKHPRYGITWRRSIKACHFLFDTFIKMIPERTHGKGNDLFTRLCQAKGEVEGLDDRLLVSIFVGIIAGAFDTTSLGVTSMAYLLAKHPQWQQRLREQALDTPFDVDYKSPQTLAEIEWVWKESLRLFPVAGSTARRSLREVQLGEYRIPPSTQAFMMTDVCSIDPRLWSTPSLFDPERFSPERAEDKVHRYSYMPFGAGPHVCPGMQWANIEVKAFWHQVLSRCRFSLSSDYDARHQQKPLGGVSGNVKLVMHRV